MLEIQRTEKTHNNAWAKFKNTFFNSYNYPSRRKFYDSGWSILLGCVLTIIVIACLGYNPMEVLYWIGNNSINSNVLIPTIVSFLLASLSIAICFKAGIFNIGVSGNMMLSGFITLFIIRQDIQNFGQSSIGSILLAILLSIVLGVFSSLIIGFLKTYLGLNEVVTSIMLNWIIFFLIRYFVITNSPLLATSDDLSNELTSSYNINQIPSFFYIEYGSWYTSGWTWVLITLGLFSSFFIWALIKYSKFGYKIRMLGLNPDASDYSGTNKKHLSLIVMIISGVLSALAGFIWYFSTQQGQLNISITMGPLYVGFTAIAISLIVFDNPIAIIFSSILFSFVSVGSKNLMAFPEFPTEMIDIISGIFIYSAAFSILFSRFLPYQWTRNFVVLVRYKDYRMNYWKNWSAYIKYINGFYLEKKELFLLWKQHHKDWRQIRQDTKNKIKIEENNMSQDNKFVFKKLDNEDQIKYLSKLSEFKKQQNILLNDKKYFERISIKSKRKNELLSWKNYYKDLKTNILNKHFGILVKSINDTTEIINLNTKEGGK